MNDTNGTPRKYFVERKMVRFSQALLELFICEVLPSQREYCACGAAYKTQHLDAVKQTRDPKNKKKYLPSTTGAALEEWL